MVDHGVLRGTRSLFGISEGIVVVHRRGQSTYPTRTTPRRHISSAEFRNKVNSTLQNLYEDRARKSAYNQYQSSFDIFGW